MVMSVLHGLGLNIGAETDLMGAHPHNPEGHWEHVDFLDLDDAVLGVLGGGWDYPPDLAPARFDLDALKPLMVRARELRAAVGPREPWGWKDPRTSLLLPFWFKAYPDLKVVICLRNPLEVAESLRKRGSSSRQFGVALWKTYNQQILETSTPNQRLITHYLAYFQRPHVELERLRSFAGLTAHDDRRGESLRRIKPMHRHNTSSLREVSDAGVTSDVVDLYRRMCDEAGWVESEEQEIQAMVEAGSARIRRISTRVSELESGIQRETGRGAAGDGAAPKGPV